MQSCEEGCALCRMMWLQDPNPDPNRLNFVGLYLHAETAGEETSDGDGDKSVEDINLLHFSSEEGQYRLNLSISALPGKWNYSE
jgi:hypothetical protein